MSKTFRLIVSSPEGNLFDDQAACVSLRGVEGELAIMAGHIPFITAFKAGDCRITLEDESLRIANTDGGLLTVSAGAVTVLSGSFRWKSSE